MRKIIIALAVIIFVVFLFFWKVLLLGKVAFPGDILVGMYYPWLSEKYGYEVGVPVKNPMLSDPVAQDFVWKSLIAESYRKGGLPLWNPYSYSGYPLMANFQSGALYPFNLLLVWLGDIRGWNWLLITGVLGSALGMYLYLVKMKLSPVASGVGAITYSFSGFAMTWMQFASGAQTMIWLPFLLLAIELFVEGNQLWVWLTPATVFFLITAGQAHIGVYTLLAAVIYAVYRAGWKKAGIFLLVMGLGAALTAPQLLPTLELSRLSVRGDESYISAQRWGLIPVVQLVTGIANDFFGNPATGNHWGWWQYHETIFYAGVMAVVAITGGLLDWRNLGKFKFFLGLALAGLALGVDWPVGRLPYRLNLPILATGSAGRVFVWYTLGAAVLAAWWVDKAKRIQTEKIIKSVFYPFLILGLMMATVGILMWILKGNVSPVIETKVRLLISLRNSAFPLGLLGLVLVAILFRRRPIFGVLIGLVVIADLFRAGWKYLPFVDVKMVYPEERVMTFLKEKTAGSVMRIDRERGEVLPPNTWAMYRLSSPSGYDPLATKEYTVNYERQLNGNIVLPSRYAELTRFDAQALGRYNVKYLLAIKRDEKDRIPGNKLSYKIDEKDWKRVLETENVAVLENSKYQLRARIDLGDVKITNYEPGKMEIAYAGSESGKIITIADAHYPGWQACEGKECLPVSETQEGFMEVVTKNNKGEVRVVYKPDSFKQGMEIAAGALILWLGMLMYYGKYGNANEATA